MGTQAIKRRLDRLINFAGGPPRLPIRCITHTLIERRADGSLWRKPYDRRIIGGIREMIDGKWEPCEGNDDVEKGSQQAEK